MELSALATLDTSPWSDRLIPLTEDDPRDNYPRDRDRVIHCASFRKLQHKTQVLVVHEGDYFRTRLTHSLEVMQIGRTLARWFGLTEPLVETICLSHDLGHAPFGHAGEYALKHLLEDYGMDWNANAHSLNLVEYLDVQYPNHRGLNLTWAVREGLARHSTRYDVPDNNGEYHKFSQPSMEAQVANIADVIAYCTHDVEDALLARLLEMDDLHSLDINIWATSWKKARIEVQERHSDEVPPGVDYGNLLISRIRRHLIDLLVRDVYQETSRRVLDSHVENLLQARSAQEPLVAFSQGIELEVDHLLDFMMKRVYGGPTVARQNSRADHIISALFKSLLANNSLLPTRIQNTMDLDQAPMEVARFLASLTDRGAMDLFAELFVPTERTMGHHVL
ncbi:MAG: dNTP triphosphohydrolase [Chloroflexota bacterium]|nr:dNTP triphosphohydrolase [Chloroflexota bacterium]